MLIRPGETYWMGYRQTSNDTFLVQRVTIYRVTDNLWSSSPDGQGWYWTPKISTPVVGRQDHLGSYQVFFHTYDELISFMQEVWFPRATERLIAEQEQLEVRISQIRQRLASGITWTEIES